ncbi:MAG: signal peptidase I [Nanoarchaeota archaeon]|nr:signal peptidase I [Nanoarchaeota archaeon]
MNNTQFFWVGILILLLCGCAEQQDATDQSELHSYLALQEAIVDMEEEVRGIVTDGPQKNEITHLYRHLNNITNEFEQNNKEEEFVQEKFTSEIPSPQDRVQEEQITVYKKKVILNIDNVYRGFLLDTNSMDPVMDEGTTTLAIKPEAPKDIQPGDIVLFSSDTNEYHIIHRIIEVGEDEQGMYYITKGDNNPTEDPTKVRFEDIVAVVVGILY